MTAPRIRPVRADDAARIAAIYAPYVRDGVVSFETEAPDAAAMAARIAEVTERFPWLVGEQDGIVVAYAYAGTFRTRAAYRWAVETTVYVDGDHVGNGHGRAVYAALLDAVRAMGFVTAVGIVTLPNPASAALHEALGFAAAGTWAGVGYKFGRWHDVGVWQRDLAPRRDEPAEPLPPKSGDRSA